MRLIKTKPILWFLQSKGWTEEKQTVRYHVMQPPANLPFEQDARFFVPLEKFETWKGYEDSISGLLDSISFLYDIEFTELELMFSKSLDHLKKDIQHRQGMVEQAS